MALQQIAQINALLTEVDKVEILWIAGGLQPSAMHTCWPLPVSTKHHFKSTKHHFALQSLRTSCTISTLQLTSVGEHATTLDHMLQCGMQYGIVLGMFPLTDEVVEHRAIVSQNTVLVSSRDYINAIMWVCSFFRWNMESCCQHFNLGMAVCTAWCKASMSSRYLMDSLWWMSLTVHSWTYLPPSSAPLAPIYNDLCLWFISAVLLAYSRRLGHHSGILSVKLFKTTHLHDWNNTMYCYNVFCTL